MAKYTEELAEKIVSFIEADTYSISEICTYLGIARKSFYEWKDKKPEFREAIAKATECRDEKLLMTARSSLKKKLEGYTLTEIRTTYVPDKNDPDKMVLKSRVVKEKEYAPDTHSIRLVLSRNDDKESIEKEANDSGMTFIVSDPKTVEHLQKLRENLKNSTPEETNGEKAVKDKTQLAAEPEQEQADLLADIQKPKEEEKKTNTKPVKQSKYVVIESDGRYGYKYLIVKRSKVSEDQIIRDWW